MRIEKGHTPWNKGRGGYKVGYRKRVKVSCNYCGSELYKCLSLVNKHNFCNHKCKGFWMSVNLSPKKGKKYGPLKDQSPEAKQERKERQLGGHDYLKSREWHLEYPSSSAFKKGRRAWNKGMTGENSHMYGRQGWWKGKTILPEVNKKIILKSIKKPNYMELGITNLLNNVFPNEYIYSGNGKVRIGGRIPDWFNVNGKKKVIEFFGRRWHKPEDKLNKIEHYKKFGFDCLVIWSEELKNMENLKLKLVDFHNKEEVV